MKLKQYIFALLSVLFLPLSGNTHTPAPSQQQPIALVGGTVHTLSGEAITGGTVLMVGGKIEAVGLNLDLPAGTEVIDTRGKHVYPTLILGRTTLGLTEIGAVPVTSDLNETGNINPSIRAEAAFHPESNHIPVAAVNGIGVAITGPTGGIISGLTAAMLTDGWTWEQMTLKAPTGLSINWPNMADASARDQAMKELNDAFDSARRYMLARKAAQSKQAIDIRWEAMIPVLEGNLPVMINAAELRQIQAAIAWAEKQQVKMILVGGRDAAYVADQLKAKDIPVMISPVIGAPSRQWEAYDQSYSLPLKLHQAGVKYSIAGEGSAAGASRLAKHAAAAVAFGLPQEEALKAITIYAAEILGIDDQVGTIEAGKDASIMITTGNPLELSTQIEQVFIQGRTIDMTDKHRQLYEKYLEKHRQAGE
ncbi:MAG: amidohydrolase family protein [Bacteroidales bacterium]|nr:amidohydrolase family protein [Bacteroidales bacterium]